MSTQNIIELAKPALWFDMETGHWKVLSEPDRPTYEPYYTREQMREFAALVRAQALEEAAGVCENTLAQHYMKQVILTHDEALLLAACADCATAIRALKEKP